MRDPSTRFRRRGRRLLLIAATLCAALAATGSLDPGAADAASAKVTFLQFNVCGKACGTGTAVVRDIEQTIEATSPQPHVLTLNEMCRSAYTLLTKDMPAYHGRFETTKAQGCTDGTDYGDVILLRTSTFTSLGSWTLPEPVNGEDRRLTCLKSTIAGASRPLVTCVTHIDYQAANTATQIAAVANRVAAYSPANAVLVGGDFNSTPTSTALNTMYNSTYPGGQGRFVEMDSANHARSGGTASSTYNQYTGCGGPSCPSTSYPARRKIDYLFLSTGAFSGYAARVSYTAHSDHMPLIGSAVIN